MTGSIAMKSLVVAVQVALILGITTWYCRKARLEFSFWRTILFVGLCLVLVVPTCLWGLELKMNSNDWGGGVIVLGVALVPALLWVVLGRRS